MKHHRKQLPVILLVACLILSVTLPVEARYFEGRPASRPFQMPGLVEVQFEADVSAAKLALSGDRVSFGIPTLDASLERIGAFDAVRIFPAATEKNAIYGTDDMTKFYTVSFPEEADINQVMDELRQNPYVRTVFPIYALPVDINPDDPSFLFQWGLKKIYDTAAYNIEVGSDTAKIAIIDSGVLYSHPDLIDNIWVNPGEDLDGDLEVYDPDDSNMIDNNIPYDYYDDLVGYDFFSGFVGLTCWTGEDCNTPDNNPTDFNGHGTHVAGVVAAISNNNLGGAGTAGGWGGGIGPNAGPRIICCRAGGSAVDPDYGWEAGFIRGDNAATAISYAADKGVCAINMSFGLTNFGSMTVALSKAQDSGVVLVHSAGNEGTESADYYDTWERNGEKVLVSVAWTKSNDTKDPWSNYGTWIDLSAPGTGIYSTYSSHGVASYATLDGSSFSAPFVVGAVALIKSHMPDYDRTEITPLILDNTDDMPNEPLWYQGKMGSGRLNTYKPLLNLPTALFASNSDLIGEAPLYVEFSDASPFNPTSWYWTFGDGGDATGDPNPGHTYNDYGLHTVTLTVDDDYGTNTEVKKNMVMVTADTLRPNDISAKPDTTIDMEVYLDNKYPVRTIVLPIIIRDQFGDVPSTDIDLDSVVVEGTRAYYFERVRKMSSDPVNNKYIWILYSNYYDNHSNYLPADTGVVMKLRFSIGPSGVNEQLTVKDTAYSGRDLLLESIYYDYKPVFVEGTISIFTCDRGDANLDGLININDITLLIDWLYQGGWWPPDPECGDVNDDGVINILDITYLIAYLYQEGPPPPP